MRPLGLPESAVADLYPVTPGEQIKEAKRRHPGVEKRLHSPHGQHRAQLDKVFERLVRGFRKAMMEMLGTEPPGATRHLRAYLQCVSEHALQRPRGHFAAVALMADDSYRAIWNDFIEEACAYDDCDARMLDHCRAAAETLWMEQATLQRANPQRIARLTAHLLATAQDQPASSV